MIKIQVGEQKTMFTVHRSLLCSTSAFFRAAINWPGFDGTIYLEYEDPADFEIFTHYVYFKTLYTQTRDNESTTPTSTTTTAAGIKISHDPEWTTLSSLYLLGDRLQSATFKNALITALIEKAAADTCLPVDQAQHIYANTVACAPLRRLIVDFHVFGFKGETLRRGSPAASPDLVDAPREFLGDVLEAFVSAGGELFAGKKKGLPWVEDVGGYHEFEGGVEGFAE